MTRERTSVTRVAADAAVLLAVAPGTLFFLGWKARKAYLRQLGVYDTGAFGPFQALMVSGVDLLILPALVVAGVFVVDWLLRHYTRAFGEEGEHAVIRGLAVVSAGSVITGIISLNKIGDDGWKPLRWFDWTITDYAFASFAVAVAFGIIFMVRVGKLTIFSRFLLGDTPSGGLLMVALTVVSLGLHADSVGGNEGNDYVWGCTSFPAIRIDAPAANISSNDTYLLIAHDVRQYWLRPIDMPGNNRTAITVPETAVLQAETFPHPAQQTC